MIKYFRLLLVVLLPVHAMRPVPWITEDAISFLESFFDEHENPTVLEFGAGASTIWMAKRTNSLASVEHEEKWYQKVIGIINESSECNEVNLLLKKRPYYSVCDQFEDESFDLILVDGRNRKGCILHALSKLKPGGVLMLDNSERKYYHAVYPHMAGWKTVITHQTKPDSCGFVYKGNLVWPNKMVDKTFKKMKP